MSGANVEIRLVRLVGKGVVGGLVVRVVKLLILVEPKTSLMLTQALITSIPTRRLQLGSLLFNGHHPLSELPSRDTFANWLCIHIIYRLARFLVFIDGFALRGQALGKRILIDIVLVVQLRHGEATDSLG